MCDGLGSRWIKNDVKYKHLIPLDNLPIVFRTVRQLKQYNTKIILIAPDEFKYYPECPNDIQITTLGYREDQNRTLIDGILKTEKFWKGRVNIILGDVIFSHKAIKLLYNRDLYNHDYPIFILGRKGRNVITGKAAKELFALSFTDFKIKDHFQQLLKSSGKLWNYYYQFHPHLIDPEDYTDDIDSPQAFEQFYPQMLQAVRGDKNE